jgi:hypothetical protein
MTQLSSQLNLVFRLFLPLFVATIILLLSLALIFSEVPRLFGMPSGFLRFILPGLLFLLGLFWWKYLWRLHRADADEQYLYLSNYSTTLRYKHSAISTIRRRLIGPFELLTVSLVEAGSFGQDITFLASRRRVSQFAATQADWKILINAAKQKK